jgi:hypothetical protein
MAKNKTKTARESWFDSHVIVMGPDSDFEDKMREALKAEVCGESKETKDD